MSPKKNQTQHEHLPGSCGCHKIKVADRCIEFGSFKIGFSNQCSMLAKEKYKRFAWKFTLLERITGFRPICPLFRSHLISLLIRGNNNIGRNSLRFGLFVALLTS